MYKHIKNIFITWLLVLSVGAFASTEITLNSTTNGALTEDSELYDGYHRESYYFQLNKSMDIIISVKQNSFKSIVHLYDNNNNFEYFSTTQDIGETLILRRHLKKGLYILHILKSEDSKHFGEFSLSVKEDIKPSHVTPIIMNSTLKGKLTNHSDLSISNDNYTHYYSFTVKKHKTIILQLLSNDYIPALYLLRKNNKENKFYINSRIKKPSQKNLITLRPGTYRIDATTKLSQKIGSFTLKFMDESHIIATPININEDIDSTANDHIYYLQDSNEFVKYYTLTLEEKKDIIIKQPDTQKNIEIYVPNSLYSNGYQYLTVGEHTVVVRSKKNNFKNITFNISTNPIVTKHILLNSTTTDSINTDDGKDLNGYHTKRYSFTLSKDTWVNINVQSNHFSPILTSIYNDDDTFGPYDLRTLKDRISVHLTKGIHSFYVSSLDTYGDFTLNLQEYIPNNIGLNTKISNIWSINSIFRPYLKFDEIMKLSEDYIFTINEPTDMVIELKAQEQYHTDRYYELELIKNNKHIKMDSVYSGFSSYITLKEHLTKGEYRIKATTIQDAYANPVNLYRTYTLSVHEKGITPNAWLIPAIYTPMLLN